MIQSHCLQMDSSHTYMKVGTVQKIHKQKQRNINILAKEVRGLHRNCNEYVLLNLFLNIYIQC